MSRTDCTFCRIVAREIPAHIIAEDDLVIVFLSRSNHPLIVPKEHIPDIYSMPADVGSAVMAKAIRVSRAVKEALECDGVYLTQSNEPAAGQDVFHFHMHVYPCWGDRMKLGIGDFVRHVIGRKRVTQEIKVATADKLRKEMARA